MHDIAIQRSALKRISQVHPDWSPELRPLGEGLDAVAFLAHHPIWGAVAIRVNRNRFINNDNDKHLDSNELGRQEYTLANFVRSNGIKAPKMFSLIPGETAGCILISEYVSGDDSKPNGAELGQVLGQLHSLTVPPHINCIAQVEKTLESTLAQLIISRSAVIERFTGKTIPLPSSSTIVSQLGLAPRSRSLLHMDFRPDNLICQNGRIIAVLDWANALIGPPSLELARVSEYGAFNPEFIGSAFGESYQSISKVGSISITTNLIYHLYTAIMLTVVFLSEAPDPDRARAMLQRTMHLAEELTHALPRQDSL